MKLETIYRRALEAIDEYERTNFSRKYDVEFTYKEKAVVRALVVAQIERLTRK